MAEKKSFKKKKKDSRRGNNEGSIYQRADGKWVASVTLGYDNEGKRIRKVFYGATRTDVAIKMTAVLNEKLQGGHASVQNDNLQVLMAEWLRMFKKAEVSARTYEADLIRARIHIYPQIGDKKLRDITANTIQALLNNMTYNGYALATVRKVKFLLNQFFTYAKKSKFVNDNPVADCIVKSNAEHKEQKTEKYKAIPIEAREKIIETIGKSELLKPICMTCLFAGLRIGETLALKWKDIDFKNKIINVDNAITEIPTIDKHNKVVERKTVISDTKTAASVREVPIPDILLPILKEWREIRKKRQKETGISFVAPEDIVFSTNEGTLRTYYGTRAMFNRLMKENGLEQYHFHFHTLRHTYGTMLFEMQENPKIIQMLMGHRNVTTTIQTYNSVDRTFFKQATDKLEKQFKKN